MSDRLFLALLLLGSIGVTGTLIRALTERHYQRIRRSVRLRNTAPTPRILAFSGPGCSACQAQKRILEQIAAELGDALAIEHLDATAAPDLAQEFGVIVVPTTVVAAPDGRIVAINGGLAGVERLKAQLASAA